MAQCKARFRDPHTEEIIRCKLDIEHCLIDGDPHKAAKNQITWWPEKLSPSEKALNRIANSLETFLGRIYSSESKKEQDETKVCSYCGKPDINCDCVGF